jgi:hypothetical protein
MDGQTVIVSIKGLVLHLKNSVFFMVYVIPKYSKHTAGNYTTKYKLGIICPAGRIQFSKY